VVNVADPYGRILGFLDRSRSVPDPLLFSFFLPPPPENLVVPGIEPGPPDL
jgi:hypothetical protein